MRIVAELIVQRGAIAIATMNQEAKETESFCLFDYIEPYVIK